MKLSLIIALVLGVMKCQEGQFTVLNSGLLDNLAKDLHQSRANVDTQLTIHLFTICNYPEQS